MVRKIVGTLMLVGNGKVSIEEFYDVVSQQKEFKKTSLAPPQGLYLTHIKYPFID
jgi:tRNA pseudouridine38-40 synthase